MPSPRLQRSANSCFVSTRDGGEPKISILRRPEIKRQFEQWLKNDQKLKTAGRDLRV